MKCPNCQFENREEAIFCRKCGSSLGQNITCSNCGASHPPDSSFCDKCGNNLQEPIETPPIDYSKPKSYTPKFLAEKILTSKSTLEGERKTVTVFFADVTGFTSTEPDTLIKLFTSESNAELADSAWLKIKDTDIEVW